jgi:hypothetical protein
MMHLLTALDRLSDLISTHPLPGGLVLGALAVAAHMAGCSKCRVRRHRYGKAFRHGHARAGQITARPASKKAP